MCPLRPKLLRLLDLRTKIHYRYLEQRSRRFQCSIKGSVHLSICDSLISLLAF